ncbi:arylesterase [Nitrosococcus watsonii]|uniref:arylesterase n=1 Tax=Nitrosococcus watsonii TaxID=473531 RepID=UPI0003191653|nr:arylesterase [Nitrosococcus watsonii]
MMKLSAIFRFSILVGLLLQPIVPGAAAQPAIVILGDSLSASYGLSLEQGWVARLQERLLRKGYPYQVVNASISGETTRGALGRLDSLLAAHQPEIVVIELGGNDGLRGLSLAEIRQNFARIIEKSQQNGAQVLLVKMRLPPNYGPLYTERFEQLFTDLKDEYGVTIAPFILRGIATQAELMQADGIHPRAEAQTLMLDNIWPALASLLATDKAGK